MSLSIPGNVKNPSDGVCQMRSWTAKKLADIAVTEGYPQAIKHGNGTFYKNGGFNLIGTSLSGGLSIGSIVSVPFSTSSQHLRFASNNVFCSAVSEVYAVAARQSCKHRDALLRTFDLVCIVFPLGTSPCPVVLA